MGDGPPPLRRQVDLRRGKAAQIDGRSGHSYQDETHQEERQGTADHRAHCDRRSDHPEDLAQGETPSPADPLHAEAPDQCADSLPQHVDRAGHTRHGRLSAQINANESVDGEGSDESCRAQALGEEQHDRYLPGNTGVVLHVFLLFSLKFPAKKYGKR